MPGRRHTFVARRRLRGLTQTDLARACKASRETVSRWERGISDPNLFVRPALEIALRVSPEELDELLTADDPEIDPVLEVLPEDAERREAQRLLSDLTRVALCPVDADDHDWTEAVGCTVAPTPAHVGPSDVARVRAATAALRAMGHRHGGGGICWDAIAAQVAATQRLLGASSKIGRAHV
jgi:transcriptional regulator with XRE-family HTH domain